MKRDATFLTIIQTNMDQILDQDQNEDFDDFDEFRSDTLEGTKKNILDKLFEYGDYIGHNKLSVLYGHHDIVTKQNKAIDHNNEYKEKQEIVIKKKK